MFAHGRRSCCAKVITITEQFGLHLTLHLLVFWLTLVGGEPALHPLKGGREDASECSLVLQEGARLYQVRFMLVRLLLKSSPFHLLAVFYLYSFTVVHLKLAAKVMVPSVTCHFSGSKVFQPPQEAHEADSKARKA